MLITEIAFNFLELADGDPQRIYLSLRFKSKSTTFTVGGPAGETHIFGVNQETYTPCQTEADGYYSAVVIATYGSTNGMMIQTFADNSEATAVGVDDVLSVEAT